jgi:hypothetical protein
MCSKPIIAELSTTLSGGGGITAQVGARSASTGRSITATDAYGEISTWANSFDLLLDGREEGRVQQLLRDCPVLGGYDLHCFRGRTFDSTSPPSSDMGPPPSDVATDGRYNQRGQSVLYLCTVKAAVEKELHGASNIWIQEFRIPIQSMRIADLRQLNDSESDLLNQVMWHAELAGTTGYATIQFSQYVACLVSSHFDGMLVPGVRGDDTLRYDNLVVFRPREAWRAWLGSDAPTRLA